MTGAYLLRTGTVVSMDPSNSVLENCDVLIEGSKIAKIGPSITTSNEISVIDATNCIISPGFVDTHRHTWQTQLRTITSNDTLFEYLVKIRNVYGSCYTPDDVYLGNYCGALESINAGITCLLDHCHIINSPAHSDAAVKGLKDAKIRGVFCYGLYRNPLHEGRCEGTAMDDAANPGWREADAARVRSEHFPSNEKTDLLRFGFAPAEMELTPLPVTLGEVRLGRSLGAAITTGHVSMGYFPQNHYIVRAMAKQNLLGPDLLFSHGATLENDEIKALAEAGASISSTPDTELQMGMGQPVCFRAHEMGCHASLGCDVVCNNPADMFQQMRLAIQSQRHLKNKESPTTPLTVGAQCEEVLRLATLGGAEAMGLENVIGSITVGKRADILITSCDSPRLTPLHDPIAGLVLYANTSDIDTVLIDGEIVKQKGTFVHADWNVVGNRLRRSTKAIIERSNAISIPAVRERIVAGMREMLNPV
jgi:cytosine/adenosine deaminase-related metal-dependent hydrolase